MMMVVVQCRWRNAQLSSSSFLPPPPPPRSNRCFKVARHYPSQTTFRTKFFARLAVFLSSSPRVQRKIERFFEISEHTSGRSLDSEGEKSFLLCDSEFPRIFLLRGIFFFSDNRFAILGITATVFFFFLRLKRGFREVLKGFQGMVLREWFLSSTVTGDF